MTTENEETILERQPWLHIYGQEMWHDEVVICGNRTALEALRRTIDAALATGASSCEVYVADGEGYVVFVQMRPYEALQKEPLPYTAEFLK